MRRTTTSRKSLFVPADRGKKKPEEVASKTCWKRARARVAGANRFSQTTGKNLSGNACMHASQVFLLPLRKLGKKEIWRLKFCPFHLPLWRATVGGHFRYITATFRLHTAKNKLLSFFLVACSTVQLLEMAKIEHQRSAGYLSTRLCPHCTVELYISIRLLLYYIVSLVPRWTSDRQTDGRTTPVYTTYYLRG